MDPLFITTNDVKRESECCFCFRKEDLFSLLEPYNFGENVEMYSTMIAACFQIDLSSYIEECNKNLYLICKNCIFRLRDAILFRTQIQIAQDRLQVEYRMKDDPDVISSECSDAIDTKEHIIKSDISEFDNTECDMNVDSEASLSNENALRLKRLKIVLKKIDYMIEIVPIDAANGGSVEKSEPTKIFVCNRCNKLFKNSCDLKKHKKLHLTKKSCKYCNKTFTNKYNLSEHEKVHLDFKDFVCDYCKREFRRKSKLKEHIMFHMGVKNIKCDQCDKYFVSKSTLASHKRYHSVRLSCTICGQILRSKASLKYHVLSHSGLKNLKCEICEKTFVRKDTFLRHKRLHLDSVKKTCKYCDKSFHTNYGLSRHEKIHL